MPYFSKFIIIFQLVLRRIYRVALEIAGDKLYISQLPGLQYKKKFLLLAPAMQEISNMQIKQINSEKEITSSWKVILFEDLSHNKDVYLKVNLS